MSKGIVVFSGGSAANSLVDVFDRLIEAKNCPLSYVIPISDNGGSSSELIRVFGGPGIGDLRSRLVRLIPDYNSDQERIAIKGFFNYRLSVNSIEARNEWQDIVEALHPLWNDISSPKKELIRSFLNLLNLEVIKRNRPSSVFNFSSASIGNMFLTGARLFTGSLESAIYLLSSICTIPASTAVLPAINTNFTHHISAGLADGTSIPGQNAISHPSEPTAVPETNSHATPNTASGTGTPGYDSYIIPILQIRKPSLDLDPDRVEDANPPGSLPTLRKPYIAFRKASTPLAETPLPVRIERIWYINPYGQEIRPAANPKVLAAIHSAHTLIYSIGSLYTSLIPSLVLRGVGRAIAARACPKVLLLNGCCDRETGSAATGPFSAADFVAAVARAGLESSGILGRDAERAEWRDYVSHVLYLDGEGTPRMDKGVLAAAGIETVRLYGRRVGEESVVRYDEAALTQALMALAGGRDLKADRSRRNTLEA